MYCTRCGALNDDQAAYCVRCGQPLDNAAQAAPATSDTVQSVGQSNPLQLVAQMVRGNHQHMTTDVSLTNLDGTELLLARRPSAIHRNYEIVNPQGQIVGTVNHESHLTRSTFRILDAAGKTTLVLQMQTIHSKYTPPKTWLEDEAGNQVGTIGFQEGFLSFQMNKLDGTEVFDTRITVEGGIREKLQQFGEKRYAVTLFDPSFPMVPLLGIIAAIDTGLT